MLTPNSSTPDCGYYQADGGFFTSRSFHPGGVNSLFMDGSVHFLKNSINQLTYWQISTRASGEVVSADSY
jgi:prepilin-type processing-associated H-X9-DG protein